MADLDEALVDFLIGQPGISALVARRIYPDFFHLLITALVIIGSYLLSETSAGLIKIFAQFLYLSN